MALDTRLGGYELLKELSGGGVGSTWLARPFSAEGADPVTIFRLYRHLTKKPEVADAVLREAAIAQRIRFPNVLAVLEAHITDGEVFVVSEYAEGETLAALLTSAGMTEAPRAQGTPGPPGLPASVVLRIGFDVLHAVAAAHATTPEPLVHGELSPQYIGIGADGVTRVSGFGVARVIAGIAPMGAKSYERLAYAAPERVKGMAAHADAPLDPRADLFSVGVILWEALARQRLFASKLEAATLQKVLTAPIPALASIDGVHVPAAVDAAIQRSLERDPARRFSSAEEMIAALEAAAAGRFASRKEVSAALEKLASKSIDARKAMIAAAMSGTAAGDQGPASRKRGATLMGVSSPLAEAGPAQGALGARLAITAPTPKAEKKAAPEGAAGSGEDAEGGSKISLRTAEIDSGWGEEEETETETDGVARDGAHPLPRVVAPVGAVAASAAPHGAGLDVPAGAKPASAATKPPTEWASAVPAPSARGAAPPRKPALPIPQRAPPAAGKAAPPPAVSHAAASPRATAPSSPDPQSVTQKLPTVTTMAATSAAAAVAPAPESGRGVEPAPISGLVTHAPTPTGPQGFSRFRGRAASAVDRLRPGTTLGRYEILLPVAKGGMAAVWAARLQGTRGFQKIVAVKTMLPDVSDDPDFQTMFLDEARVAARIRHPNIIEILDLGEEDDVLYLVMEWVDGETLSMIQKAAKPRGGVPMRIALRIASQICAGLHNAHELRDDHGSLLDLVHRDVSPANVLISTAGFVKIVDFGVAKSKGRLHVTRAGGVVKGKTPYLSPEQLGGLPIDRRSDIFSLGALLYVMTTGLHPFRGETEMATVENIALKNPLAPRELNESIHPDFGKIIQKALEKDRALRFSTCAEMQRAIDQVASTIGEPTTDEDVANFVRDTIGHIEMKRAQDLRDAIAAVEAGGAAAEPRLSPSPPAVAEAPVGRPEAVTVRPPSEAGARPSLSDARIAPVDRKPDIADELSFKEDFTPPPRREVVHPPKLIIAPSARPPPPPPEPEALEGASTSAPTLPAMRLRALELAAAEVAPLKPAALDAGQRWKRRLPIGLGVLGLCAALALVALVRGGKGPEEPHTGTTTQATTTVAEPPAAKPPEAQPPAVEPQPPEPAPPTPPSSATRTASATPKAPTTTAQTPSTPRTPPPTSKTPPKPPPSKKTKYEPTGI